LGCTEIVVGPHTKPKKGRQKRGDANTKEQLPAGDVTEGNEERVGVGRLNMRPDHLPQIRAARLGREQHHGELTQEDRV